MVLGLKRCICISRLSAVSPSTAWGSRARRDPRPTERSTNLRDQPRYCRCYGGNHACNAGDKVLEWHHLPSNRHPVISMNMYRLLNGRMEQIGQSWLKHGFVALQQNVCGFGCQPSPTGEGLGVGCGSLQRAHQSGTDLIEKRGESFYWQLRRRNCEPTLRRSSKWHRAWTTNKDE